MHFNMQINSIVKVARTTAYGHGMDKVQELLLFYSWCKTFLNFLVFFCTKQMKD